MAERTTAAIVLAGGEARRFGGDKLAAPYRRHDRARGPADGPPTQWFVVCVGPERPTTRPAAWTREDPPGGGPVAGIAAGCAAVPADLQIVVVLAGDQPHAANAAARLVEHLAGASPTTDAAVAVDDGGRRNPLMSAFRRASLVEALPEAPAGRAARSLLEGLAVEELAVPDEEHHDIDRRSDL